MFENRLTEEERMIACELWVELMAAPNATALETASAKLAASPRSVQNAINFEIFRLWQHGRHNVEARNPFAPEPT